MVTSFSYIEDFQASKRMLHAQHSQAQCFKLWLLSEISKIWLSLASEHWLIEESSMILHNPSSRPSGACPWQINRPPLQSLFSLPLDTLNASPSLSWPPYSTLIDLPTYPARPFSSLSSSFPSLICSYNPYKSNHGSGCPCQPLHPESRLSLLKPGTGHWEQYVIAQTRVKTLPEGCIPWHLTVSGTRE